MKINNNFLLLLFLLYLLLHLELVSQLNGLYYTWKNDTRTNKPSKFGFIAQEVEKVIPELVKTNSEGMKSVDYIGVIPDLV